jgi:signal peptidase I
VAGSSILGAGLRRVRAAFRRARAGTWRVAVTEASMLPAIEPGDWLLVDPTVGRWPRRGSVVIFREPLGGDLAIKRVAGRPGERVEFGDGFLTLEAGEAWLVADADAGAAAAAGYGPPIDSHRFGPVGRDLLVARAWFRYWPPHRIGRIGRPPAGQPPA